VAFVEERELDSGRGAATPKRVIKKESIDMGVNPPAVGSL
jgi:hypothetical protein